MTRKTLVLFAATSVIWGSSFLFIRVAVAHLPPSAVVFGRTVLGAAFLVPLAARARAFRGLRPVIVPIAVVTVLDMAAPTLLTAWGEQHISSSVAGILTATDPLFTAVLALWLLRSEVPGRKQLAGLVIGFAGVIALLGIDFRGSPVELLAAGAVLLSALGYAAAALVYRRWLPDVPAIGVTALMTAISSLAFLAPAAVNLPRQAPPASSILALATLGILNTGVAYWLFYLLIDHAGAATASVITYVMPVVALFLGVGLLGEQLTIGAITGLILIGAGAWLATSRQPPRTSGHPERHTMPGRNHRSPPPPWDPGGRAERQANRIASQTGRDGAGPARHRRQRPGTCQPDAHDAGRPQRRASQESQEEPDDLRGSRSGPDETGSRPASGREPTRQRCRTGSQDPRIRALSGLGFPPGGETVRHDHISDGAKDVYAIVQGAGASAVIVDGQQVPVRPGQFIALTPDSVRHVRAGDGGLVFIAVCAAPA